MNEGEQHPPGAKRQKTEAAVSDAKNRLVSAIKAMIDSMNEEHLYSVMVYAGTVGKELLGSEKAAADTSAARKATIELSTMAPPPPTTTTKTENAGAKTTTSTTTTGAGAPLVTSTPRTPQERTQEATPPPIQLNKNMRPIADTVVKIVPRCFHFGRTNHAADDFQRNKVQLLVDAIAKNGMSLEQQAFALQQAVIHPLVRPIAKSAGLVDNNDFMIKNYFMNNLKRASSLAQKTNNKKARTNDDLRSFVQSLVSYQRYHLHSNRSRTK